MRKGVFEVERTYPKPSAGGAVSRFRKADPEPDSPPAARVLVPRCQGVLWEGKWRRCWCGHAPIDPESLGRKNARKIANAIAAGNQQTLDDLVKRLLPDGCRQCQNGVWRETYHDEWIYPTLRPDSLINDVEYAGDWSPIVRADAQQEQGDWNLTEEVLARRCKEARDAARAALRATGHKPRKSSSSKPLSLDELLHRRVRRKARSKPDA